MDLERAAAGRTGWGHCYSQDMPPSPHAPPAPGPAPSPAASLRAELAECVARLCPNEGVNATAIPALRLIRHARAFDVSHVLYEPALCLLAQGRKRVVVGDQVVVYDALHHLVSSHHIPVAGQVVQATPPAPYLCVWLALDPVLLSALVLEQGPRRADADRPAEPALGIYSAPTGEPLLSAVLRLVRLLQTPQHIAVLAPLAVREIMYWLLAEREGWRLAQYVTPGTPTHRVSVAMTQLRERFHEPLRIEALAQAAHMSASSLHVHFKAQTGMSPLQYQKKLRLQEARRLLMSEARCVADVAHRVGYESPSQFGREYLRMYGATPARDMRQLRVP